MTTTTFIGANTKFVLVASEVTLTECCGDEAGKDQKLENTLSVIKLAFESVMSVMIQCTHVLSIPRLIEPNHCNIVNFLQIL